MTIADIREKCKSLLARDVLIVSILIAACLASFGLGYLAGQDAGQGSDTSLTATSAATPSLQVVASKTGTKYYLPGCPGVDKITEENKVWFASGDLARAQGYEPAANCKGI